MKKSVMIGLALVFAFVALFIIMETEDSDAAIKNDCGNAYVKGVKYDLCTGDVDLGLRTPVFGIRIRR